MSSRALTVGDIKKMYDVLKSSAGKEDELSLALIHTTVTIAFTCLMRIDEVLNLRFDDIIGDDQSLTITLRHRKTAQFGGENPCFTCILNDIRLRTYLRHKTLRSLSSSSKRGPSLPTPCHDKLVNSCTPPKRLHIPRSAGQGPMLVA